jgi:hypothetical protein
MGAGGDWHVDRVLASRAVMSDSTARTSFRISYRPPQEVPPMSTQQVRRLGPEMARLDGGTAIPPEIAMLSDKRVHS